MLDASLIFDGTVNASPSTGVTGAAITTTRVSTNVLDMLTGRDIGVDSIIGLHVLVTTAFTVLTSLQIDVEVGATAGGTYFALAPSPIIPVAQLIIGAPLFRYAMPLNQILNATAGVLKTPGQFIRLNYTVVGTAETTGAVFSYMTPNMDRQQYWSYPENYVTH